MLLFFIYEGTLKMIMSTLKDVVRSYSLNISKGHVLQR